MKKAFWLISLVALLLLFLCFSSPNKVVVSTTGRVDGFFNQTRILLQGKDFWEDQLGRAVAELQWELTEPQREAEFEREMAQFDRGLEKEDEQFYRDNPDLRPSPAELAAERLRERADQIEMAELGRELEQYRIERIAELRMVIKAIKAKTNES